MLCVYFIDWVSVEMFNDDLCRFLNNFCYDYLFKIDKKVKCFVFG